MSQDSHGPWVKILILDSDLVLGVGGGGYAAATKSKGNSGISMPPPHSSACGYIPSMLPNHMTQFQMLSDDKDNWNIGFNPFQSLSHLLNLLKMYRIAGHKHRYCSFPRSFENRELSTKVWHVSFYHHVVPPRPISNPIYFTHTYIVNF